MIKPDDEQTFNITFKTTNEGYSYILNWLKHHTELISDRVLPDTDDLYESNESFRAILKKIKKDKDIRDSIINKQNK